MADGTSIAIGVLIFLVIVVIVLQIVTLVWERPIYVSFAGTKPPSSS